FSSLSRGRQRTDRRRRSACPYSKREPVQYSSKISPYCEFTFQILSAQAAQHRRVSEQNEGAGPLFHSISVFGRRTACTQHPDASSRTHHWGYASTPRRAACRTASIRSDWGSRNNERVVRTTLAARVYVSYPYFHPTVVHQPRNRRRSIRGVRLRLVRRE